MTRKTSKGAKSKAAARRKPVRPGAAKAVDIKRILAERIHKTTAKQIAGKSITDNERGLLFWDTVALARYVLGRTR
jgi:hypothetical protein